MSCYGIVVVVVVSTASVPIGPGSVLDSLCAIAIPVKIIMIINSFFILSPCQDRGFGIPDLIPNQLPATPEEAPRIRTSIIHFPGKNS